VPGKPNRRMAAPRAELTDPHAQFLIAVGDLCAAAELAGLRVEVVLGGGRRVGGIPGSLRRAERGEELNETGHQRTFRVNDALVNLEDILECVVHAPTQLG
jgi:hypothetical protein